MNRHVAHLARGFVFGAVRGAARMVAMSELNGRSPWYRAGRESSP
jgi:hypothetical protein